MSMVQASRSCGICQNVLGGSDLDRLILDNSGRSSIKAILSDIAQSSSRTNCQLCRLVVKIFQIKSQANGILLTQNLWKLITVVVNVIPEWRQETYARGVFLSFRSERALGPAASATWWKSNGYSIALRPQDSTLTGPWSVLPVREPPSRGIRASASKIKNWLIDCEQKHKYCKSPSFSPRRLLDVSASDRTVRLVEVGACPVNYLALSYAWGMQPQDVTTKVNYATRMRGFSGNGMYPTHREAIDLCRELGYRYLWIDAFCIIQDDDSDRMREIDSMDKIYAGAVLVLSAAHASSVNDGCLNRNQTAPPLVKMPLPRRQGFDPEEVYVLTDPAVAHTQVGTIPDLAIGTTLVHVNSLSWPISARGWCIQERLLATRIVHFGLDEMYWECRSRMNCECGFLAKTPRGPKYNFDESLNESPWPVPFPDPGNILNAWRTRAWRAVIAQASTSKLTHETDRLPSLSGVAKMIDRPGLGKYLAGMFQDDLLVTLAWHSELKSPHKRASRYVAPSWAWTSVVGPIQIEFFWMHILDERNNISNAATINHVNTTLATPNPYSTITGGRLRITGLTCTMTIDNPLVRRGLHRISGPLFCRLEYIWDINPIDHLDAGAREVAPRDQVKTLLLWDMMRKDTAHQAELLVLKPVNSSRTSWRRVGLLRLTSIFDGADDKVEDDFRKIRDAYSSVWKRETLTII